MTHCTPLLNPSEAARKLGVSAKALRLYEQRGLIAPIRTAAGWRVYGPEELARAREIVALRDLRLTLSEISRVLNGNPESLEPALAEHEAALKEQALRLAASLATVRRWRTGLAMGQAPAISDLVNVKKRASNRGRVAFDLPWPWGGEHFELDDICALTYIIGPLGSGKTRLAKRLAESLPGAVFIGMDRMDDGGASACARLAADPALKARVDRTLTWLIDDGATDCDALVTLLVELETEGPSILVVDMLEHGLDGPTQEALIAWLRRREDDARPLFVLTRSSCILDLTAVGSDEAILLCPANHSPPTLVAPYPGTPGYEAVATCLATPEVRARTQGVIAWRPDAA